MSLLWREFPALLGARRPEDLDAESDEEVSPPPKNLEEGPAPPAGRVGSQLPLLEDTLEELESEGLEDGARSLPEPSARLPLLLPSLDPDSEKIMASPPLLTDDRRDRVGRAVDEDGAAYRLVSARLLDLVLLEDPRLAPAIGG